MAGSDFAVPLNPDHEAFVVNHTNDNGLSDVRCTSQARAGGPRGRHRMALRPDADNFALVDLTGDSDVLETAVMSVTCSEYQNPADIISLSNFSI